MAMDRTELVALLDKNDPKFFDEIMRDPEIREGLIGANEQSLLDEYDITNSYLLKEETFRLFTESRQGLQLPFPSLHDKFWWVKGEMSIISGFTGHGKSQLVGQMALHALHQGSRPFIASLELQSKSVLKRLFVQSTGITDPTWDYFSGYCEYLRTKMPIYQLKAEAEVENILKSAQRAFEIYGSEFFIFDNLMMLQQQTDDYTAQFKTVKSLVRFAKENDVVVILVAHSKKPGKENTPPSLYDVCGSSTIVNLVDNHFSFSKNFLKEEALKVPEHERSPGQKLAASGGDAIFKRDKKREIGENFVKHLYFDRKFEVFKEYESQVPFNYLEGRNT